MQSVRYTSITTTEIYTHSKFKSVAFEKACVDITG